MTEIKKYMKIRGSVLHFCLNNIHDDINFIMHLCILQEMNNIN